MTVIQDADVLDQSMYVILRSRTGTTDRKVLELTMEAPNCVVTSSSHYRL